MNATASATALLAQQTALQAAGLAETGRADGVDGRGPRDRFTQLLRQQSGPGDAAPSASARAEQGAVRLTPVGPGQNPNGDAPRGSFVDIRV
ncbi:MAG: hypothetical protein QNJ84_15605 [Alphaproteobacteria bacterium]|nr:hypothetical protein [Alphaproteobacteria bacterium]